MRTEKQNFELFKKECNKWITRFGLIDWHVSYFLDNPQEESDYYAFCETDVPSKHASIYLCPDWLDEDTKEEQVRILALHEVCELFLADYESLICDKVDSHLIETTRHAIIRRLENLRAKGWLKK